MRSLYFFFFSLIFLIQGFCTVDFDCVFVGSSPFCLLEAIYQSKMGKKVVVIEKESQCGGAWQTISVCGIPDVDLGCHEIGADAELELFLKNCLGCRLVSLDRPLDPFTTENECPQGFYFSKGCSELIEKIQELIRKTDVSLWLDTQILEVEIEQDVALVKTNRGNLTTDKIFATQMSAFSIREQEKFFPREDLKKESFYHFYFLVEDPIPPSFSYTSESIPKAQRAMNLTHFTCLSGTGRHLLIVQTRSKTANGEELFYALQKQRLVSDKAILLDQEFREYQRFRSIQNVIHRLNQGEKFFHFLETTRLEHFSQYIPKWKEVLEPLAH
jgi:hypothetical protein